MDNERAKRAAEIRNLPARYVELGEPMDKKTAEGVVRGFPAMVNKNDGRKVRFPVDTIGKILLHRGFDLSRIVKTFPELYETSLRGWSEPEIPKYGHKAHINTKEYHHYVNKFLDLDGGYYIRFTVNEEITKQGKAARNFIHSVAVSDIAIYKKDDGSQRYRLKVPGEVNPSPFVNKNNDHSHRIWVIDPGDVSPSPSVNGNSSQHNQVHLLGEASLLPSENGAHSQHDRVIDPGEASPTPSVKGVPSRRDGVTFPAEANPTPFIDRRLLEFFNLPYN